jgi:hypothetical protein
MHVRVFGDAPDPEEWASWTNSTIQSLFQFAAMRRVSAKSWTFEMCDPLTWGTRTSSADIHIYLTEPCRVAVPWATCNVVLVSRAWWQTVVDVKADATTRVSASATKDATTIVSADATATAPATSFGSAWLPWAATEIDLFVVGPGEPVEGLPADRVFTLRKTDAGSARASPLRMYSESWRNLIDVVERRRHPPALPVALAKDAEIPHIGIITLTRNRPQWWPVMVKNVAGARWPLKQLEWIIVDDSDEGKGLDAQVEELRGQAADLTVRYVRLTSPASIGAKRNAAVAAASEGTDLFVCMDDDDHYPEDSIGRRVSWITDGKRGAVYCSTIPMYDTTRYISAMNAPPMILGAAQRISEATLAFTRAFWTARPFPDVSMAEGEGFVVGRETQTVEIPPYGVIVSFIHKTNTSSRRVPVEQPANGCHYGFTDEFFTLVTELGMK